MTRLGWYVQRSLLAAFAIAALALAGLLGLLDLVGQLALVGQGDYHFADALRYVALTMPARLLAAAPAAMLIATLLTLGRLAERAEAVVMLSLGVSQRRIAGLVLWLVLPVTLLLFLLSQFVIPPAQQAAQTGRSRALASSRSFHAENTLWATGDHQYLSVQRFTHGTPMGIDIYRFLPDGRLDGTLHADSATILPGNDWRLEHVRLRQAQGDGFVRSDLPSTVWHCFLAPSQVRSLFLPVDAMPPVALAGYVRAMGRRGQAGPQYLHALWQKLALPFSLAAMVLIAAPLAGGVPRLGQTGRRLGIGAGLGLAYLVGQQLVDHLATLIGAGAAFGALMPPAIVITLMLYLAPGLRD